MSVRYDELIDVHAYGSTSPPYIVMLNVEAAGWPKEAKSYAEAGSKCEKTRCPAEARVLMPGSECALQ